jgi:predicted nucleic acid-binding protein
LPPKVILLDACVLYSAPLRDLLLRLALHHLFRAHWTNQIHDEWAENLLRNRPNIKREAIERTRQLMDRGVQGALISGYEHRIDALQLPDADDRHVLAAAIESGAETILTFNLQDFPAAALAPHNMEALHPDTFVRQLLEHSAEEVIEAIKNLRGALRNPPKSAEEYLDALTRCGLPDTAQALQKYIDQL